MTYPISPYHFGGMPAPGSAGNSGNFVGDHAYWTYTATTNNLINSVNDNVLSLAPSFGMNGPGMQPGMYPPQYDPTHPQNGQPGSPPGYPNEADPGRTLGQRTTHAAVAAGGVAATLGVLALANIWNPGGWVIGGLALAAGAAAFFL